MNSLIGYWPLQNDLKDYSPLNHKVINHNVQPDTEGAIFNGRDSYLEIPSSSALQFGRNNFTISAEIYTEKDLDDIIGDILSKYDETRRKGFNLSVVHHAGVVSSQTNYRNLAFSIDNAAMPLWQDCGRPGNAVTIWSMAVYQGSLYVGTYEPGTGAGHVYRYEGQQQWTDCGVLDGSNNVGGLAVYQGKLYAATQRHDSHGSLLPLSQNDTPGGRIFRYEGDGNWVDCGKVCDADNLSAMVVYRGRLYTSPWYAIGVYRYEGGMNWSQLPSPDSRFLSMTSFNGYIYATANRLELLKPNATHAGPKGDHKVQKVVGTDGVFRYSPETGWEGCGNQEEETQLYASTIYKGQLYVGSWPNGSVFRYLGGKQWQNCGQLAQQQEIMGLGVYNGKLYAGSLPSAEIYRFDGINNWTRVGCVDHTPDVPLRRAVNIAICQGRAFFGTLPSGHIYSMEVGKSATWDYQLSAGWNKITAVKSDRTLILYLNGKQISQSTEFVAGEYDLSNDQPLKIGFGSSDYFYGRIKNLRIFNYAIMNEQI